MWNCLDGETTLGGLAAELAEVYDAPADTILADLVPMIRDLLDAGLLEP